MNLYVFQNNQRKKCAEVIVFLFSPQHFHCPKKVLLGVHGTVGTHYDSLAMVDRGTQLVVAACLKIHSSGILEVVVVGILSGMADKEEVDTYGENIRMAVSSANEVAARLEDVFPVAAPVTEDAARLNALWIAVSSVNVSYVVHLANSEVYLAEVSRNLLGESTSHARALAGFGKCLKYNSCILTFYESNKE